MGTSTSPDDARPPGIATARQYADNVNRKPKLGDHTHHAVNRRRAAHVVLHLRPSLQMVDGDAAGVEGQAFTHQHDRARVFGWILYQSPTSAIHSANRPTARALLLIPSSRIVAASLRGDGFAVAVSQLAPRRYR